MLCPYASPPVGPVSFSASSLIQKGFVGVPCRFLRLRSWLFLVALWGIGLGCTSPQPSETVVTVPPPPSVEPVDVQYARGFSLRYDTPHPTLLIHGPTDTTRYLLLPAGTPPPDSLPIATTIIYTPVQRIVATSTTHLGLIEWLDARDHLVGIGNATLVYDEVIRQRVQQGRIQEVGTDGALNLEQVLSLRPDLVMVSATPGVGLSQYQVLRNADIPVIVNAEWQESSPLAKAEWVKLMAALLQEETDTNRRFAETVTRYDSIAQLTQRIDQPPQVITGSPFQGSWYVPGRHSYVGQLLRDARVRWPWAQDSSAVSIGVSLETVYPHGLEADYWINPGQAQALGVLAAQDDRLAVFQPYRQGQVYNHYRRVSPTGGNDYYEGGTVRPDVVLADLVEIFHPEILDHSLYYYQRLE